MVEDEFPEELPDERDRVGTRRGGIPDKDPCDDRAEEELDERLSRFHQVDDIESALYKGINDKRAANWGNGRGRGGIWWTSPENTLIVRG
jgi:hypothetical protein